MRELRLGLQLITCDTYQYELAYRVPEQVRYKPIIVILSQDNNSNLSEKAMTVTLFVDGKEIKANFDVPLLTDYWSMGRRLVHQLPSSNN